MVESSTLDDPTLEPLTRGRCPDCGGSTFVGGPQGGLAVNTGCADCGSWFNLAVVDDTVWVHGRIPAPPGGTRLHLGPEIDCTPERRPDPREWKSMTTNSTDRKTLLEIEDLLDRADWLEAEAQLEAEECRVNSSTGGSSAGKKISYAEFMARRAGISLEEQERRMGLVPHAGQAKARS